MKPDGCSQEYGVKQSATVGTRVKEAPGLGAPKTEMPEWEELKTILLQSVDHAVLRRLQKKGHLK